jgi:hypothetical protein
MQAATGMTAGNRRDVWNKSHARRLAGPVTEAMAFRERGRPCGLLFTAGTSPARTSTASTTVSELR